MKIVEITESFTSSVDSTLVRATRDLFTRNAVIGNRSIVFNAARYSSSKHDNADIWEIEFIQKTPGRVSYSKTGAGNEMQVFSFVIECMRELIARYSPSRIEFSSHQDDKNRTRLYAKMLQKIRVNGYTPAEIFSSGNTDFFALDRIDNSEH